MIKKIWKWIKHLFSAHCPNCGGDLKIIGEDKEGHNIYVCENCHTEWF